MAQKAYIVHVDWTCREINLESFTGKNAVKDACKYAEDMYSDATGCTPPNFDEKFGDSLDNCRDGRSSFEETWKLFVKEE